MSLVLTLTELTLPRFLLRRLLRRDTWELWHEGWLPPLAPFLKRLAGTGRTACQLAPELAELSVLSNYASFHDVFGRIEPWQNRIFGFADAETEDPRYGYCFKQITCKYLQEKYPQVLLRVAIERRADAARFRFAGMLPDTLALYEVWTGRGDGSRPIAAGWIGRAVNALLALAVAARTAAWILARLRPSAQPPEAVFFAADYLQDPRDALLYAEAEDGGEVLLVPRNARMRILPEVAKYRRVPADRGRFPGQSGWAALREMLGDVAFLLRRYGCLQPPHFYRVIVLPFKRTVLRAFFHRFRPRFFWCRDEYNVEHILRRQELNAVGGTTIGLMHGVQSLADLNPMRRYISFDVFYVFGLHLYKKHYAPTWAPDMRVRAMGSFGFSRAQWYGRCPENPTLIAVFASYCVGNAELTRTVRAIAEAFPQYAVEVKLKRPPETPAAQTFAAACAEGLGNVRFVTTPAADLIARARYVLSDPSTVVTESIHYGVPTLFLDFVAGHQVCLYRDFPGLTVRDAEAAVARLRAWEEGRERFRREAYADLIDLSGRWVFDMVREVMGLPDRHAMPSAEAPDREDLNMQPTVGATVGSRR